MLTALALQTQMRTLANIVDQDETDLSGSTLFAILLFLMLEWIFPNSKMGESTSETQG